MRAFRRAITRFAVFDYFCAAIAFSKFVRNVRTFVPLYLRLQPPCFDLAEECLRIKKHTPVFCNKTALTLAFMVHCVLVFDRCVHEKSRRQAKFLTSRHVRMHRVIFYISNTLRKLMVKAQGLVFRSVCRVRFGKRKIIEV